jgi:hypothetical protein
MEKVSCTTCQKPKASLACGICHSSICKNCAQFLEEDQFSFLDEIPPELISRTFCDSCFDQRVQPLVQAYQADIEKAKEIIVFLKKQSKETHRLKRSDLVFTIEKCPDREETLLRLAFKALRAGYNAIIDVDIRADKVRSGSYQTSVWHGVGIPAHVDLSKMPKDRSFWQNPN